jgi:hypothetical protein
MKRNLGLVFAALIVTLILVLVAIIAAACATMPLDQMTITIHGETFSLAGISGWHAGLVIAGAIVVVLLATVAAALAVAFALGMAGLAVLVGLAATVASIVLVASPLILVGWLVWRLVARPSRPRPAAA